MSWTHWYAEQETTLFHTIVFQELNDFVIRDFKTEIKTPISQPLESFSPVPHLEICNGEGGHGWLLIFLLHPFPTQLTASGSCRIRVGEGWDGKDKRQKKSYSALVPSGRGRWSNAYEFPRVISHDTTFWPR